MWSGLCVRGSPEDCQQPTVQCQHASRILDTLPRNSQTMSRILDAVSRCLGIAGIILDAVSKVVVAPVRAFGRTSRILDTVLRVVDQCQEILTRRQAFLTQCQEFLDTVSRILDAVSLFQRVSAMVVMTLVPQLRCEHRGSYLMGAESRT